MSFRLHPLAAAVLAFNSLPAAAQSAPAATEANAADPATTQATTLAPVRVEAGADSPIKAEALSSPKFTQPLVDTPQTIAVLKKELLVQQGALSLSDALRQTPGITFQQGENGNSTSGDALFLRGR